MTPPARLPAAVLLDWDNTLVDSWPVIHEALCETFLALERQPWTLEETKQRVHHSLRDSFPDLFGTIGSAQCRFTLTRSNGNICAA